MSKETELWAALQATPSAEIRRRAAVVDAIERAHGLATWGERAAGGPTRIEPAERYAWEDGGGQSTVWYFFPDGRILLTVFDHEEELNLYAEEDYATQLALYDGVPDDLMQVVLDQAETSESLNLKEPETGRTVLYASGVFWYDGRQWHIAEGLIRHVAEHFPEADVFDMTGFAWCIGPYLLGREFTEETVLDERTDSEPSSEERDQGARITREVFARYA